MARPLRIEYDGAVYHVTSRGNDRKAIYRDDEDREQFLVILAKVNKRFNWICHAYCLMNNHYHLIIETPDGNLSSGMRQLNGMYTQLYNRRYNRSGHIFQGRYKAILIEKESHLAEVCRYVVLNPVRARSVKSPEQWQWSSFSATAGKASAHACLSTEWIESFFSAHRAQARRKYEEFVSAGAARDCLWDNLTGQVLLGSEEFAGRFQEALKGQEKVREIPKHQRYLSRPGLEELLSETAIADKEKRNEKIREAILQHGYSNKAVAEHLGLHYSTISRLLSSHEAQK